jgi:hypothetical protein
LKFLILISNFNWNIWSKRCKCISHLNMIFFFVRTQNECLLFSFKCQLDLHHQSSVLFLTWTSLLA